jgi:hypothetical protein
MTRRKLLVFAITAVLLSFGATLAAFVAVDLYLHRRAERSAGLNRWGYRGPVLGRKQPGEQRVAMLGGSTVFGYGGPWQEAIPALLEGMLHERAPALNLRVINLGFNNEGAFAFLPTLEDFSYLDYDIVCLYEGYNDLMGHGTNRAVYRRDSPVFRLTGYFPILPSVLNEKALALKYGGDLEAAYKIERGEAGAKTLFRPSFADRTSAAALAAVVSVSDSISRPFAAVGRGNATTPEAAQTQCASPWTEYCESVHRAVRYAVANRKRVLVIAQPRLSDKSLGGAQALQQGELQAMLQREFGGNTGVAYVDLSGAVDLSDRDYSFDNMHLGLDGNRLMASALAAPVQMMAARR